MAGWYKGGNESNASYIYVFWCDAGWSFVSYPLHSHNVQLHQDHRFSISPYPLHSHNVQLHQDHRFSIQSRAFSILRVQNGGYCGRTYCAESMTDFFLQKGQIRHKFINLWETWTMRMPWLLPWLEAGTLLLKEVQMTFNGCSRAAAQFRVTSKV